MRKKFSPEGTRLVLTMLHFGAKESKKKKKLCPFFYSPDTVPSTGRLSTLGGGNPDI